MQQRGTPHFGVALLNSVEALRCSEPDWRIPVASGTPRRSLLHRSVAKSFFPYVSVKNSDFLGH